MFLPFIFTRWLVGTPCLDCLLYDLEFIPTAGGTGITVPKTSSCKAKLMRFKRNLRPYYLSP